MSSSLELNLRPQKLPPWTQLQEKGEEPTAREEAEDEGTETGGGAGGPDPRKLGGSIPGRFGAPGYPSMEGGRPPSPARPGAGGSDGMEGMEGMEYG